MTYNAAGQMTTATKNGTTTNYTYAGPDQIELVRAGTNSYVYGLNNQVGQSWIQSFTAAGQTGYIERDSRGTPLGLTVGAARYAYVLDGLGSAIGLIDSAGNPAAAYTYDPYGQTNTKTGPAADTNPIRYTGGLSDTTTGFTKLGQRYLNTTQGRFTQQDRFTRLANPENGNLYAYAACNPINFTDPSGHDIDFCQVVTIQGIVLGLIAAGATVAAIVSSGTIVGLPAGAFFGAVAATAGAGAAVAGLSAYVIC
jgi:RHS repeat-associated protein